MILATLLALVPVAQDEVAGVPYEKLETRRATRARMLEQLLPATVTWGSWYALSPFPYAGHDQNDLATSHGPESEMAELRADGAGPDLARVHAGKNGHEARWRELGDISGRRVELHFFEEEELKDEASCYLWATITSSEARTVRVTCGSDDGMRLWLNGDLLVDVDVPRGLDPAAHLLDLAVVPGVNHVLVKVAEGFGDWAFQIDYREAIDPVVEAELDFLLDRDFPPDATRAHYRVATVPVPEDIVLEVGGLDFLADGTPVVCTRRGDVFTVHDAYALPPLEARFELFAQGLHEPLGIGVRTDEDGEAVYAVQRGELTRLVDEDGDGRADLYECFSDGWGVSGNYHEFAFGPEFDTEGNAWVTLNVGFCGSLGKSVVPYRGWALKITPEREVIPVCCGLRSPNGIEQWTDGAMFYVDNQGDYVATNRLSVLAPGSWHGHPSSLRWREDGGEVEPSRQPATIWFPYRKMGQSAADIALCDSGGAFGPFDGQLFVGDQTLASVMRVFVEKVEGHYQGACFPFVEGLQCGVNRVAFAPDGSMFVGQTDRGWGSVGGKPYGMQHIVYTGETPFEILAMRAIEGGFELEFTADVEPTSAAAQGSYRLASYTYEYHAAYGAPEDDVQGHGIYSVELVSPRIVRLSTALRPNYVHELHALGVRAVDGRELLHPTAYYTCIRAPGVEEPEEAKPRVLFLTHSAGFVHDVVQRPEDGALSHAEHNLRTMTKGRFEVDCTQDCGTLTAENLARYDAVVFYTTGELPFDADVLVDWVAAGGAFVGVHCATDTFYEHPGYLDMIGGAFDGHPWHEEVTLRVEDPAHPATRGLGEELTLTDEIYQFRDWHRYPLNALLSLDHSSVDVALGQREDGDYANAWWKDYGRGRVFYTALGHRPEVWEDARFREHLLGGLEWAIAGPDLPAPPPEGAVVLFDGNLDLTAWHHRSGAREAAWMPWHDEQGGFLEVRAGTSDLVTEQAFGDGLYHVEFMVPDEAEQGGNSGVFLQGNYELQVLNSMGRSPDVGECGAIYGQNAPARNASRMPGRWQSFDVLFRAPRFAADGTKTENARMTVWHNGIEVHRDLEVTGPTGGNLGPEGPLGPLLLQDHGDPVRYRNVWVLPR